MPAKIIVAAALLAGLTGCILRPPKNFEGHEAAVAAADFPLALAYHDDYLLTRPYADDETPRAERIADFESLIRAEVARHGPPDETNAPAFFGTLVALRREARRGPTSPKFWTERQQDLGEVDARVLAPLFDEVAAVLWRDVDAKVARGELSAASVLGATIVAELPAGTPYLARLDAIGAQLAATHLELAQAAGDEVYGARILHARLAEQFGTNASGMSALPPALALETGSSWTVASDGPCGDSPISGANSDVVPLTTSLPRDGFSSGPGKPMDLTVVFDTCPVTPRSWETTAETEPFLHYVTEEQLVIKTRRVCDTSNVKTSTSTEQHYHSDGWYEHTTTTTSGASCVDEEYTDGETETVTYTEQRPNNYGVSHRTNHIAATGTIRIAFEGGVREERFSLEAMSDEDVQYNSTRGDIRTFHGFSEPQARERLHTKLVAAIYRVRDQVLEARASTIVGQAQLRAAEGDVAGAEHAFFVASQVTGRPSPAFAQWMATRYNVTPEVLAAAVTEQPVPRLDLAKGQEVVFPPIPANKTAAFLSHIDNDPTNWQSRRIGMGTLTGGLMSVHRDSGTQFGFQAAGMVGGAMPIKGPLAFGFGERFTFGSYLNKAHPFDIDVLAGAGLLVGGMAVTPLVGFGGDFTTEGNTATQSTYVVPGGAYIEYGGRVAVAFVPRLTLDATYTKARRTPDALPRESRLDVRMVVDRVAFTVRYTEYATEPDALFAAFGPEGKVADGLWLLVGIGLSGPKDLQ